MKAIEYPLETLEAIKKNYELHLYELVTTLPDF